MKSLRSLTDREWTQMKAALTFWAEVAEVSKVHPSHHPRVEPLFKQTAPLTVAEIEALLADDSGSLAMPVADAAQRLGTLPGRLNVRLRQLDTEPAFVWNRSRLYRYADCVAADKAGKHG